MDVWPRLLKAGRHIGAIGMPLSRLWEWTLSYRESPIPAEFDASQGLPAYPKQATFFRGKQVQSSAVSGAIMAIGKTITLAHGKSYQVPKLREVPPSFARDVRRMAQGGSSNNEEEAAGGGRYYSREVGGGGQEEGCHGAGKGRGRLRSDDFLLFASNWRIHHTEGCTDNKRSTINGKADATVQKLCASEGQDRLHKLILTAGCTLLCTVYPVLSKLFVYLVNFLL